MAIHPLIERGDPLVILAKGHSGTRFLAEALETNGVFMGADLNPMHDSLSWADDFAKPLILSDWFPALDEDATPALTPVVDERLAATLEGYTGGRVPDGAWGWKGSTTFAMDPLLRRFGRLRLVHLIRDGRDVALSEDGHLNLPFWHPLPRRPDKALRVAVRRLGADTDIDRYRRRIYFGGDDPTWNGIEIERRSVEAHRYLIQMEGWRRNVETLRTVGARLGTRYLEIRYERLVVDPVAVVGEVLDFLGRPMDDRTAGFVSDRAFTGSLRKWERDPPQGDRAVDFERACAHGAELLAALGYD